MLSILAWEIPWTEQPGGLQFMRSQELDSIQQLNHQHHPTTQDAHIKSTSPSFLGQQPLIRAQVKPSLFTSQSFSILLSAFVFLSRFSFFTIYDSDLMLFIQKLSISFKYKICFLSTLTDINLCTISMLCLPLSLLKNK